MEHTGGCAALRKALSLPRGHKRAPSGAQRALLPKRGKRGRKKPQKNRAKTAKNAKERVTS